MFLLRRVSMINSSKVAVASATATKFSLNYSLKPILHNTRLLSSSRVIFQVDKTIQTPISPIVSSTTGTPKEASTVVLPPPTGTTTATSPPPPPPPPPPPKKSGKIGRFFKYTFGLTTLGLVIGIGMVTYSVYKETNPGEQSPQSAKRANGTTKKNVVILGSGWGAISFLGKLDTTQYNVTIISPRNYFLFTPLLPSVPTSTVDSKSICDPVRLIARQTPGEVKYLEAAATNIDPINKKIDLEHKSQRFSIGDSFVNDNEPIQSTIEYDYLIYSVGAKVNTFGIEGIPEHASYLKEANDATAIRQKLFNSIEASRLLPEDSNERKRLLTFVVCGGGPTGVELAAEIKDYIDQDLSKFIPGISKEMNVILIEALPNVLNMFPPKLIEYTKEVFKIQDVKLKTNHMVQKVDSRNVYVKHKISNDQSENLVIPYGTLVWAGGNSQRELTQKLSSQILEQKTARRGLLIDENLKVYGDDSIYALGDCTFTKNAPTAQVAHQQGIYLADYFNKLSKIDEFKQLSILNSDNSELQEKFLKKSIRYTTMLKPFIYNHTGSLAYIGSERAVADLSWNNWSTIALGGSLTFLFWRSAYVSMILGTKSKLLVCGDWLKVAIFGRDCSKD
ncbi:hypothetical protein CANARDRAFT_30628 [[Candida] arabinofermentans NRRL YB-2248]|uniref:NADH:ubiquinone reductase (non-electrogenic) n=1 Tax=[Candida] arabinofermentans NRRL YB-2248 TaxID=983967 RepID=A0A1E4ST99_9ASCO|nr:hypothetical protein CANARDRAFT_30628 [[Candida] arabinofermentans NRRL YB-2248]